jgi:hypothetical protein
LLTILHTNTSLSLLPSPQKLFMGLTNLKDGGDEFTTVQGTVADSIIHNFTTTLPNLAAYAEINTNDKLLELVADLSNVLFTFPQLKSTIPTIDKHFAIDQTPTATKNLIEFLEFFLDGINRPTLNNLIISVTNYMNIFVEADNEQLPAIYQ